jgi:general secretion pathway protein L
MPALASLLPRLRDAAHRTGISHFWRWWTAELAPLVPAAPRGALQRRRARPVIEFADGEAVFWRPELVEGTLRLVRIGAVALTGDAAATQAARSAVAALGEVPTGTKAPAPYVVVALAPRQVLRKEMTLPMAVEENLTRTLAYDLDRHTPFRADQVYFDAAVVGRDLTRKTIRVDWVAALRSVVDGARRTAEEWGAAVVAVVPGPASSSPPRVNLLPPEARARRMRWRQWQVWLPTALVALGALAVVLVPLVQKREYAITLLRETEQARAQAEVADGVRREFERMQSDYNDVLARKYAYPSAVQIVDDVTRALPDDTWITQLEIKTTTKGKDVQRDLFLRGESANGSKLISMLEDTHRFEQAGLRSPTTKLQPGPGEVFDLGAQVKAGIVPASQTLSSTDAVPPAPPSPPQAVAPPAPAAGPRMTGTAPGPNPPAPPPAAQATPPAAAPQAAVQPAAPPPAALAPPPVIAPSAGGGQAIGAGMPATGGPAAALFGNQPPPGNQ